MKRSKVYSKTKDTIIAMLIIVMLVLLIRQTLFPPTLENQSSIGAALPKEAFDICSSGNPSWRWIECKMSEEVFFDFMKSRNFVAKKIESEPMRIGRYTIEKFPAVYEIEEKTLLPQDENSNSLFHFVFNGYWVKTFYKSRDGEKILKHYIVYDLDKKMYFEEERIR